MRKFAAILYLLIMLFNFWGYRWVISYLENNAQAAIDKKMDSGAYNIEDLIEIKIPLGLPYSSDYLSNYEAFRGQAELEGRTYQYVKRRISQDTMYILCLADPDKTQLKTAKSDYFLAANSVANENKPVKNNINNFFKSTLAECLPNGQIGQLPDPGSWSEILLDFQRISFSSLTPPTPTPPPKC